MTGVFVDQFEHRAGAAAYAADLARNEAEHYGATLIENPPGLPGGCQLLTVETPTAQAAARRPGRPRVVRARRLQRLGDRRGRLVDAAERRSGPAGAAAGPAAAEVGLTGRARGSR